MPTKKDILKKIIESQERMANALKGAYESAPDDPEIKKHMIEVGERANKLRKEIEKLLKD